MNTSSISQIDWYHTIELSETIITPGRYDWRPYMEQVYRFVGSLDGKTVLDVGTGNGFFAFEFEKQGAIVTAIDIPDQSSRDNNSIGVGNIQRASEYSNYDFKNPFYLVKEALNSRVNRIEINLYNMTPDNVGVFDIVFCNDVLLHITDPARALWTMKNLCRERLVVGLPILKLEKPIFTTKEPRKWLRNTLRYLAYRSLQNYPLAEYHGAMTRGEFWIPNLECLVQMVGGCGFSDIQSGVITLSKEHNEMSTSQRSRGFVKGQLNPKNK